MAQGKYSPVYRGKGPWIYNCYGQLPVSCEKKGPDFVYDEKTMYANYDKNGFDSYGYSAFDAKGNYAQGRGVDLAGNTEAAYAFMSPDAFEEWLDWVPEEKPQVSEAMLNDIVRDAGAEALDKEMVRRLVTATLQFMKKE